MSDDCCCIGDGSSAWAFRYTLNPFSPLNIVIGVALRWAKCGGTIRKVEALLGGVVCAL